jgi:hypothetical protein
MDSLRIDTGIKRVMINDDPSRVIEFSPEDVAFAEKFYSLIHAFEAKQVEYDRRSKAIDENKAIDASGLPSNVSDGLALLREVCEFMRAEIDALFGAGASQAAFGDARTLDMFVQFFDGITPFIKSARDEKVRRYLNDQNSGRVMK